MSDRVVVLSAGPGTHPIGEFTIDLPRPRDVAEIRSHPRFVELHAQIWSVLRDEVLKGYQQQLTARLLNVLNATRFRSTVQPNRGNQVMWGAAPNRGKSGASGSGCCSCCASCLVRADEPDAAARVLFRRPEQGGVLLRRDRRRCLLRIWEWFTTRRDLSAPVGHAARDRARVRASARWLGLGVGLWLALRRYDERAARSVHQGRRTRCRA